jgi:hypothetical protein
MTERPHIVPPGTQIARYTPGSAVDLKVGAKIFIAAAQKQPDGSLTAPNVAVGRCSHPWTAAKIVPVPSRLRRSDRL